MDVKNLFKEEVVVLILVLILFAGLFFIYIDHQRQQHISQVSFLTGNLMGYCEGISHFSNEEHLRFCLDTVYDLIEEDHLFGYVFYHQLIRESACNADSNHILCTDTPKVHAIG